MSFSNALNKAKKEGMIKSSFFKIKEGDNRIRIVSDVVPFLKEFQGEFNARFAVYVIDRTDGQVKRFDAPKSIADQIGALEENPDYSYEGLMPYDITLNAKGAGTKEVKYSVIAARNNTELTKEEKDEIAKMKPIEEAVNSKIEVVPPTESDYQGESEDNMPF